MYIKKLGVEVDEEMPKAIVFFNKNDNKYHNAIVPNETYPLMKRVPYGNSNFNGVEFGTKVAVEDPSQIDDIGICAIECNDEFMDKIKETEYIDIEELEEKMLCSDLYFKDRIRIIEQRINNGIKVKKKVKKLVSEDWEANCHYMDQIFYIREENKKVKMK